MLVNGEMGKHRPGTEPDTIFFHTTHNHQRNIIMSLEAKIEANTAAIIALTAVIAASGIATVNVIKAVDLDYKEDTPLEAPKETAADRKAKAKKDADAAIAKLAGKPTPAEVKKAERDATRQAEIDAESADTIEFPVVGQVPGDATEADCRTVATYIMKVVKDKAGLAKALAANNTNNLSNFKGDYNVFLADLEAVAGKSLAEIA